jgi:hypothetical protein
MKTLPRTGTARRRLPLIALAVTGLVVLHESSMPGCVVGYVNVPATDGNNFIANPLAVDGCTATSGTSNSINLVLATNSVPDGTIVYKFDPTNQAYLDGVTLFAGLGWYSPAGKTNDPGFTLNPGEGFCLQVPPGAFGGTTQMVTLVGNVLQGSLTNPIPANYSLKGHMLPISGALQTSLKFRAATNDIVWLGPLPGPGFSKYAYTGIAANWSPSEPVPAVAKSFFVQRNPAQAIPANWWITNFTVLAAQRAAPAEIAGLTIRDGLAILQIAGQTGPYDVQFSSDGADWKTVAANQTGPVWVGPWPGGEAGFYQLVNP